MNISDYPVLAWRVFFVAAALEVGGDAVARMGLRGNRCTVVGGGCLMLAAYGLVVDMVTWDFSKLLGVYVAIFAVVSILAGRFAFHEEIAVSTWIGLSVVVLGGLIIQFGGVVER